MIIIESTTIKVDKKDFLTLISIFENMNLVFTKPIKLEIYITIFAIIVHFIYYIFF